MRKHLLQLHELIIHMSGLLHQIIICRDRIRSLAQRGLRLFKRSKLLIHALIAATRLKQGVQLLSQTLLCSRY
ncbi:hypothetical protein D3C78_1074390 [compost metagenome]